MVAKGRLAGFTLIEILVVIAVIAVLAGIVAPSVFQHVGEAKSVTARSQVEMLSAALSGRRDSLLYDQADLLTRRVLPNGQAVLFGYDSSGNLTSVTPPSRPAHAFQYTAKDVTQQHNPPGQRRSIPGAVPDDTRCPIRQRCQQGDGEPGTSRLPHHARSLNG